MDGDRKILDVKFQKYLIIIRPNINSTFNQIYETNKIKLRLWVSFVKISEN